MAEGAETALVQLLGDLNDLARYLRERGRHAYNLAQKFAENAQRHPDSREYDERQATMLDYQHYIWNEVAGLVEKLVMKYADEAGDADTPPPDRQ
jgi:hypothetical protein